MRPYVTAFKSGHTQIIAQRVDDVVPVAATVLGWEVKDIEKVVAALRDRGAVFEKYEMQQDELGIWNSPAGKVAWFKNPDGNILSVSEHPIPATARASRSRRRRTGLHRKPKAKSARRSRPNTRLQPTPRAAS